MATMGSEDGIPGTFLRRRWTNRSRTLLLHRDPIHPNRSTKQDVVPVNVSKVIPRPVLPPQIRSFSETASMARKTDILDVIVLLCNFGNDGG